MQYEDETLQDNDECILQQEVPKRKIETNKQKNRKRGDLWFVLY